jgi:hypothetical protein
MAHTYSDKNNPGTGLIGDILVSFKDCIATGGLNIEEFFCKSRIYQRKLSLYTVGGDILFIS